VRLLGDFFQNDTFRCFWHVLAKGGMKVDDSESTDNQEILTTPEVAKELRVCSRTVTYRRERGEIPYLKLGRSVRFLRRDIEAYIAAHRIGHRKSELVPFP
jgi:excisionase family DNA binding protein